LSDIIIKLHYLSDIIIKLHYLSDIIIKLDLVYLVPYFVSY